MIRAYVLGVLISPYYLRGFGKFLLLVRSFNGTVQRAYCIIKNIKRYGWSVLEVFVAFSRGFYRILYIIFTVSHRFFQASKPVVVLSVHQC